MGLAKNNVGGYIMVMSRRSDFWTKKHTSDANFICNTLDTGASFLICKNVLVSK